MIVAVSTQCISLDELLLALFLTLDYGLIADFQSDFGFHG